MAFPSLLHGCKAATIYHNGLALTFQINVSLSKSLAHAQCYGIQVKQSSQACRTNTLAATNTHCKKTKQPLSFPWTCKSACKERSASGTTMHDMTASGKLQAGMLRYGPASCADIRGKCSESDCLAIGALEGAARPFPWSKVTSPSAQVCIS